ncbi:MAG: hypothetical protein LBR69_04140 [Endomicrobium sp.]|jgi:DNA-binding cell septation regulator SpoVG|nr:hypothetical protein [Endomicrobium sp.]
MQAFFLKYIIAFKRLRTVRVCKVSKVLAVLAAVLPVCVAAYADTEIKVTDLEKNADGYSVVLNGALKISGIKLKKTNSGSEIEFPRYVSKGAVYRQISVLNRDYKKYLTDIIENVLPPEPESAGIAVSRKINKFKVINNHRSVKAFMSVIFGGCVEAECRIMNGKYGTWVAWPAVKKESRRVKNFEFTDFNLKKEIESELIGYYNERNGR